MKTRALPDAGAARGQFEAEDPGASADGPPESVLFLEPRAAALERLDRDARAARAACQAHAAGLGAFRGAGARAGAASVPRRAL